MKKQTLPLVSVVMTAFNAGNFIDEAMRSILSQTYRNLELIIIDDGSTDSTWKRIKYFRSRYKCIHAYHFQKNGGPSEASNFAIRKARGIYIARMDADDISYPTRIEQQVAYLQENPSVLVVGGQCDIIDENGRLIGEKRFPLDHERIRQALFAMNPIQHPGSLYRREVFTKYGIRYEKRYFVSHDLKILFKILAYGKLANIPNTVLQYRHRPDSITHKNPKQVFAETIQIRHWAVLHTRYTPNLSSLVVHILELIAVSVLPKTLINRLFWIWRMQSWEPIRETFGVPLAAIQRYAFRLAPTIFFVPFLHDSK